MALTKELEEQLKVQRDKLLDLSGRNSLINFKFNIKENARSQNYLRIVDEVPELIIDKKIKPFKINKFINELTSIIF